VEGGHIRRRSWSSRESVLENTATTHVVGSGCWSVAAGATAERVAVVSTRLKSLAVERVARLNCIAHPKLACPPKPPTSFATSGAPRDPTWSLLPSKSRYTLSYYLFSLPDCPPAPVPTMFIARSEYDRGIK
jgi:hypothetical protein